MGKTKGSIVTQGEDEGIITVDLLDKKNGDEFSIKTIISWNGELKNISKVIEKNKKTISEDAFSWRHIFVAAYGAVDRTLATSDHTEYSIVDAVDGLFNYSSSLQNPELTLRRLYPNGVIPNSMQNDLKRILGLEKNHEIRLTKEGMFIRNGEKKEVEFGAVGDGYQSTLTWVLDLAYWWILKRKNSSKDDITLGDIEGIVIVDEIENHLHPEWEKKIISSLSSTFPNVQFIMSTHSPLVASGSESGVYNLHGNSGGISPLTVYGWAAEHILKDVMGLKDGSRADGINKALDKYDALFSKMLDEKASNEEKKEMAELEKFIEERTPGDDASLLLNRMDSLKNFLLKSKG